jgi:adenine phosphoribosyltransferase
MDSLLERLDRAVRRVPDFPKKGVLFYDITGILSDGKLFTDLITRLAGLVEEIKPDALAAIEARGFIFGAAVCDRLSLPFIPVRKKGKLPGEVVSLKYSLEYAQAEIEIHKCDIPAGKSVLLMDDLVATGGTLRACRDLLRENGAKVSQVLGVIGLPFLNYMEVLCDCEVRTLINYESE